MSIFKVVRGGGRDGRSTRTKIVWENFLENFTQNKKSQTTNTQRRGRRFVFNFGVCCHPCERDIDLFFVFVHVSFPNLSLSLKTRKVKREK